MGQKRFKLAYNCLKLAWMFKSGTLHLLCAGSSFATGSIGGGGNGICSNFGGGRINNSEFDKGIGKTDLVIYPIRFSGVFAPLFALFGDAPNSSSGSRWRLWDNLWWSRFLWEEWWDRSWGRGLRLRSTSRSQFRLLCFWGGFGERWELCECRRSSLFRCG